jgi:hypothetical protein
MAEPERAAAVSKNRAEAAAEPQATTNRAAFLHWLRAVHGLALAPRDSQGEALRRWAAAEPRAAAARIRQFAGDGFPSARLAAGLLLEADLRPDDRVHLIGPPPDWLPVALLATQGRAPTAAAASLLICDALPPALPLAIRRVIVTGAARTLPGAPARPSDVTVSHAADWTYPSESSAD